jgi:hypothetical protein
MFKKIGEFFLKKLYKFLIYKTIVLSKESVIHYKKMDAFCTVSIDTDKGPFIFVFREDRRKQKRSNLGLVYINNFVVELTVPDGIISVNHVIENKLVMVVKVMLFKVNYKLLTEVLTDIYLDVILNYINARETNKAA